MSATAAFDSLILLTDREREHLVRAIEAAVHVRRRHQFFLWAQGQFRGVLPHAILVCVRLDDNGDVLQLECLHGSVLGDQVYDRLCDPVAGLAVSIARRCCVSSPLLLSAAGAQSADEVELVGELARNDLRNALACATDRILGGNSVYILFDVDETPGRRHAHLLELLVPHLQMSLLRLAENSVVGPLTAGGGTPLLSLREFEILRLLQQGNSNQTIGTALGISPLTVKNHVQKIYRKLKVQNRAHAVSRGISLRLLDSSAG